MGLGLSVPDPLGFRMVPWFSLHVVFVDSSSSTQDKYARYEAAAKEAYVAQRAYDVSGFEVRTPQRLSSCFFFRLCAGPINCPARYSELITKTNEKCSTAHAD
jgi:hypothetical protein